MGHRREEDVNTTLLALYGCAVDPEQMPNFLAAMEDWLQNTASDEGILKIEAVSEPLWKNLTASYIALAAQNQPTHAVPQFSLDGFHATTDLADLARWHRFCDTVYADDVTRLRDWMASAQGGGSTLIRSVGDEGATRVYIVTRTAAAFQVTDTQTELSDAVEAILVDSFGISHSEMTVLRNLVIGQSVQDISAALGKSPETIRSQVKSLSQKLSVKRQQDIQRIIGSIEKQAGVASPIAPLPSGGKVSHVIRENGRKLFYTTYGPKNGFAVLVCPDFSGGSHLPKGTAKSCALDGLRAIVLTRSGYGMSGGVDAERRKLMDSHRADHLAVLAAEGVTSFAVVGMGTGMALAYDLALKNPDQVVSVIGLNIYPPVLSYQTALGFKSGMYRVGALASLYTPKMLRVLTRFVITQATHIRDAKQFFNLSNSPKQQQTGINDGSYFTEFMKPNLDEILAGKGQGSAADCTYLGVDWAQAARTDLHRPPTVILHHADFPFCTAKLTRLFAASIGAEFALVPRPFRQSHHDIGSLSALVAARLK